ncbi:hypothetical protein NKG05_09025 [Oerskovia sp. M15]
MASQRRRTLLRGRSGAIGLVLVRDAVGRASATSDIDLADGLREGLAAHDLGLTLHLADSPRRRHA